MVDRGDQAVAYFDSVGLNHEFLSPVGTDAFSFNAAGIPASGLLTGQDCCKSQEEVDLFGGTVGNYEGNVPSFDGGCVDNPFLWCDNLSNNDPTIFTTVSQAFADMVVRMAFDTSVVWSEGGPPHHTPNLGRREGRTSIRGQVSTWGVASGRSTSRRHSRHPPLWEREARVNLSG